MLQNFEFVVLVYHQFQKFKLVFEPILLVLQQVEPTHVLEDLQGLELSFDQSLDVQAAQLHPPPPDHLHSEFPYFLGQLSHFLGHLQQQHRQLIVQLDQLLVLPRVVLRHTRPLPLQVPYLPLLYNQFVH